MIKIKGGAAMKDKKSELAGLSIPKHIAFIMDGNGRWAQSKGKKRTYGHKAGSETLKTICSEVYQLGVEYITVYAFSTENWKRPQEEIDFLMQLLRQYLKESYKTAKKDNLRMRVLGDITKLPQDIIDSIHELEEKTKLHTGLKLQIALNYGGRDEIIRGIKRVTESIHKGSMTIDELTEASFSEYLDTKGLPDPDLMIRTSGELRLSNFLLWQLAYAEFYFSEKYWPDLEVSDVIAAIKA